MQTISFIIAGILLILSIPFVILCFKKDNQTHSPILLYAAMICWLVAIIFAINGFMMHKCPKCDATNYQTPYCAECGSEMQ